MIKFRTLLLILGIHFFLYLSTSMAGYTISGTVTNPNGQPVSGVDVLLYTEQGDPVGGINPGVTDINGFYSIGETRIPAGTYQLGFEPSTSTRLLSLLMPNVVVQSDITLNVTLNFGNLFSGFVTDSTGAGLQDIDLNVMDEATGIWLYLSGDNTDGEGFYNLIMPSGRFTVVYRDVSGGRLVPREITGVNINSDFEMDVFMEAGFFVSGNVTGPGGEPVAYADLDAEDSQTGLKLYTPGDNTDSNGDYELLVPRGIYNINVAPPTESRLLPGIVYNFPVTGDATLNFSLQTGFLFSGTVRDPVNNVVIDADLDIRYSADGRDLFTPSDNTDSSGRYGIIVPQGMFDIDYKPKVIAPYLAALRLTNRSFTGDLQQDVVLPYGILVSGTVRDFRNRSVGGIDIDARDTMGLAEIPLVGDFTDSLGSFSTVTTSGIYDFDFKPSNEMRLAAKRLHSIRINIDTTLAVVLDTGMVVSGTIRNSQGMPFPNVKVAAYENSSGAEMLTPGNKSDTLGLYEILLGPNTYNLIFKPDSSLSDSIFLGSVSVFHDTVINVAFRSQLNDSIPPAVHVISPNGGEVWQSFDNQTITWNATDNIGVVGINISYSINGSNGTYIPIANNEVNDGNYIWQVPANPSTDAWVRIVAFDAAGNSSFDISDGPFSIIYSNSCCGGVKGDINGNGVTNGIDVIYLVGYFKGGPYPPDACNCPPYDNLYATSDVNGDCHLNGIDVSYLVGYFKGGPGLRCCPDCPSAR